MKAYNHLVGYLHRWTICKIGKLHIRLHHILNVDGTPFLHNHPFAYVSIILTGGYTEQVLVGDELKLVNHLAPAIIIRKSSTYHRIVEVGGDCKTLFFAYGSSTWGLKRHPDITPPDTYRVPSTCGIYCRYINGKKRYAKFNDGVWYAGSESIESAYTTTTLSVHQCGVWEDVDV